MLMTCQLVGTGRVAMAAVSRNAIVHFYMGTIARIVGEPMAGSGRQQAVLRAMAQVVLGHDAEGCAVWKIR
jgi:hypothetical protein